MTHKKDNNEFLDFDHARTEEQINLMKEIKEDGVCPFCPEYFEKYHPKGIIKESKWWFLTENMSPYKGTRVHLITVYKKHATMPTEVPSEHMKEMFDLINWAIKKNDVVGGSILIRFGDTRYTGGSVNHFHAHLIIGNAKSDDPDRKSLKKKIGYMK